MPAVINAGIETATEKIPLDNLLEGFKSNPGNAINILKKAIAQAGIEISTEELSLIGTTMAESAILRESSDENIMIRELEEKGYTHAQAVDMVSRKFLNKAWETLVVSGLSGFGTSVGSSAIGVATNPNTVAPPDVDTQQTQTTNQDMFDQTADALYQPRVEEPVQQTAEDVRSAADDILGVEEPAGPEKMGVDDGETYLSRKEKGERYKQSKVNAAILDMVNRVKNGIAKAGEKIRLTPISDKNAAKIQQETGVDVRGYDTVIEARQIDHILKRHGENGVANHTMADPTDIARIEYALENPDRIVKSEPTRAYVSIKDGKNKPADTVLYETLLEDGSYYVVQAVPDTKKHTLYVLTAYIGESSIQNEAPRFSGTASPILTSETQDTIASDEAMQSSDAGNCEDTSGASANIVPPGINNVNENLQGESLSAAKEGFTGKQGYYDLLTDENTQRDRPGDVRPVEVPKTDANGKNVSEFVSNAYGSDLTSDAMANRIEELVRDNVLGFDRQSNEKSLLGARDYIFGSEETGKGKGAAATRAEITRAVEKGKIGTDDIAKAIILYEEYNSQKGAAALDNATEVFLDLQQMATKSGRNLQLFKLFRQMSPEGKFQTIEKEVRRTLDYGKKHGKITKDSNAAIPPELESAYKEAARTYMNAKSEQAKADAELRMNEAQNAIYETAAAQMKSTVKVKWDAWRYMCMLGNPKTQVRNFAGNAAFIPYVEAKRAIGAGIEKLMLSQDQRTKSVLNPLSEGDKALIEWAKSDAKSGDVNSALEGSAKLGDTKKNTIEGLIPSWNRKSPFTFLWIAGTQMPMYGINRGL